MTVQRQRVAGVVLLREPDGAALLQHRDDRAGLPHANLWVPPGGHCECGETLRSCAEREFFEETGYRCANLRWFLELDVDDVQFSPPLRLTMYWDVYDGQQAIACHEGQAVAFVARTAAPSVAVPDYLVAVWDSAIDQWRAAANGTEPPVDG